MMEASFIALKDPSYRKMTSHPKQSGYGLVHAKGYLRANGMEEYLFD